MKFLLVVGARPNFMKVASLIRAINKRDNVEYYLVHTGQHYDKSLSDVFFQDLNLPEPDVNLNIGSFSHVIQTAKIMENFEPVCIRENPDVVVVVGDVNSTLSCSIVSSKLGFKLAHVEAGERCFVRTVPEEINRKVSDVLSDFNFCCSLESMDNLVKEGIPKERRFLVGDTMVDSLLHYLPLVERIRVPNGPYVILTLHRPSNTDVQRNLESILDAIGELSKDFKIIFPMHPRTKKQVELFGLNEHLKKVDVIEPIGYLYFLALMKSACFVLTDSGSIQIETTVLDIPCISLKDWTSRNFTITRGTNILAGTEKDNILKESYKVLYKVLYEDYKKVVTKDKLWDGKAAERIIEILVRELHKTIVNNVSGGS